MPNRTPNTISREPDPSDSVSLVAAVLFALASAVVQWWLGHDLKQLPSAIFGGDWAYQEGCIRAIAATGNPLASCSSGNALPGYMPLFGVLCAVFVRLTGMEVVRAMLTLSVAWHFLSTLIVFFVVSRHFGRRVGLAATCLWRLVAIGYIVKYTEFTSQLLVPLYFDALLFFLRDFRRSAAVYLGLAMGVLGYAHAVPFVSGFALTVFSTSIVLIAPGAGRTRAWPAALAGLAIVAAGSLLALGYWWRPIFEFHGRTSLHYTEWNGGESVASLADRMEYARRLFARAWTWETPPLLALHALALLGVLAFVRADVRRRHGSVAIVGALCFAWIFHFLLTVPVLHTHFVPEYVRTMLWTFASLLLASVALEPLLSRLPRAAMAAAALLTIVAAVVALAGEARALSRHPDTVGARLPLPPRYLALQAWVYAHTSPDDVVLSSNELSFAWSALTGRKAFVSRRAQNDPFLDLDSRNMDAAIVLFGRDDAMRAERVARGKLKYLLWSIDWMPLEYGQDGKGNTVMIDPLFYFANASYDSQMRRAGVEFASVYGWVDPYLRGPEFPRFDLTVVTPANYPSSRHTWSPTFDPWLEQVWSHVEGDSVVAALYRIRPPAPPHR